MEPSSDLTLVLVNDPDVYPELSRRLERRGVKVVSVTSGAVALEMIRQVKPAMVILGYELEDLPAVEVVRRIKKSPQSRNVPVLILFDPTSRSSEEILGTSCDEALSRPIDPDILVQKISARLNMPFRRHGRIGIDLSVECSRSEGSLKGFARNISEGGVFLETNDDVEAGTRLTLTFTLPGQGGEIVVPGEVVRRTPLEDRDCRYGLGIRFDRMPAASREKILDFLVHKSLQLTTRD